MPNAAPNGAALPRLHFLVPDRSGLPPLSALRDAAARRRHAADRRLYRGSRGCRHLCRHCPVVPVYDGQFRVVQPDVVLADIAAQVAAGARAHHVRRSRFLQRSHARDAHRRGAARGASRRHLRRHDQGRAPARSIATCCRACATPAACSSRAPSNRSTIACWRCSTRDTRARDFFEAVALCRAAGVTLVPTFVAFHPWTTLEGYCDLLDTLAELDLVDHVAPIQLAIRLLIPEGSRLLELEEVRGAGRRRSIAKTLTYRWTHRRSARRRAARRGRRVGRPTARRRTARGVRRDQRRWRTSAPACRGRALPLLERAGGAVSRRALVLLRGAESGAVDAGLSGRRCR